MIKEFIHDPFNGSIKGSKQKNPGTSKQTNFFQGKCGGKLSACFRQNSILGTVEVVDYENVDFLSPSIREILYTEFGDAKTAEVTEIFSKTTDLKNYFRWPSLSPWWTEFELDMLNSRIKTLGLYLPKFSNVTKCPKQTHENEIFFHIL